jgi:hypothetical protein
MYAKIQAVNEWNEPDGRGKSMWVEDAAPIVDVVVDDSAGQRAWRVHLEGACSEQRGGGPASDNPLGRVTNRYLQIDLTSAEIAAIFNAVMTKGLFQVIEAPAKEASRNDG